ncbi:MAG: hypothetical protein K2X27_05615 [Candidatus Obscuribacterales bacterium]|nr:hypothetical protein [Candidatus Obscuribacterales bacterium]
MTFISDFIKSLLDKIVPSQKSNAWDEYKRYRAMELEAQMQARQARARQVRY